jgi:hypothetical protein
MEPNMARVVGPSYAKSIQPTASYGVIEASG